MEEIKTRFPVTPKEFNQKRETMDNSSKQKDTPS